MRKKAKTATADILPECIIHKILSSLSYDEAARLTIFSKIWRQAWLAHPNLKFILRSSDESITTVDKIMERYRDKRIPIDKFKFKSSALSDEKVFPLFDKWLDIALQNGVKDLEFDHDPDEEEMDDIIKYPFPIFKLEKSSLRELVLTGCVLRQPLSLSTWKLDSLRTLSLDNVSTDDITLHALLASCPLIVNLTVEDCNELEKIELRNLQKIRSVRVRITKSDVCNVKIEAPTLEHLFYMNFSRLGKLDIIESQNLKSIVIMCVLEKDLDGFLEHLFSRSKSLESLALVSWVGVRSFKNCRSQSLRVLNLVDCEITNEIDAPNLVSLVYEGLRRVPTTRCKLANVSSQLKLSLSVATGFKDAAGFSLLRESLSNSTSWSEVTIKLNKDECNVIDREDLQLPHRVAYPKVDVLNLVLWSSEICPTVVDALLWSCYPKRLNLESSVSTIRCFIDRLVHLKNSSLSTCQGSKPWLSELKDVKAYKFDEENQSVELKREELAIRKPSERENVYFLLDWGFLMMIMMDH